MSAEWFAKLKEYDSLSKARARHQSVIEAQNQRVNKLTMQQDEKKRLLDQLKHEFFKLQEQMAEKENQMKQLSQQKQRLIDYGGDEKKITELSEKINALEDEAFTMLEVIEQNESDREDARTFIAGIQKTIEEIATESQAEVHQEQQEIEKINLRLQLLQDELPPEFKSRLEKLLAKNLAHGPFTRIEQGSCFFCRYKISRIDESEVEIQKQLKNCPQCTRIFIPYGT